MVAELPSLHSCLCPMDLGSRCQRSCGCETHQLRRALSSAAHSEKLASFEAVPIPQLQEWKWLLSQPCPCYVCPFAPALALYPVKVRSVFGLGELIAHCAAEYRSVHPLQFYGLRLSGILT